MYGAECRIILANLASRQDKRRCSFLVGELGKQGDRTGNETGTRSRACGGFTGHEVIEVTEEK